MRLDAGPIPRTEALRVAVTPKVTPTMSMCHVASRRARLWCAAIKNPRSLSALICHADSTQNQPSRRAFMYIVARCIFAGALLLAGCAAALADAPAALRLQTTEQFDWPLPATAARRLHFDSDEAPAPALIIS